jgi:hypothetical protein
MRHRRSPYVLLSMAAITAVMGVIAFSGVASNPRFETIHVLDVIRLMTAGAAIAVTIMLVVTFFNRGPFSDDKGAGEKRGEESK